MDCNMWERKGREGGIDRSFLSVYGLWFWLLAIEKSY